VKTLSKITVKLSEKNQKILKISNYTKNLNPRPPFLNLNIILKSS